MFLGSPPHKTAADAELGILQVHEMRQCQQIPLTVDALNKFHCQDVPLSRRDSAHCRHYSQWQLALSCKYYTTDSSGLVISRSPQDTTKSAADTTDGSEPVAFAVIGRRLMHRLHSHLRTACTRHSAGTASLARSHTHTVMSL